jgi:hypothetical protein
VKRVLSAVRNLFGALAAIACALFVASLPGAAVRPLAFVLTAPPLPPETPDRDAAVVVHARAADTAPIAQAAVQVFAIVDGRTYTAGAAKTDTAGSARVGKLPRGEHWIIVQAPAHARASTHVVLLGGEREGEREVDVELGPEHVVTIEVRDDRNEPLKGAELEIASAREPLPIGARSNDAGVARVGRLGPPPWVVTARAAGYEEVVQRGVGVSGLRVMLRKLGAIAVRVTEPGGAPAAGARVVLAGASLWPARAAETGGDGVVRVGSLASGAYALRATKGDLVSPVELAVPLARGEEKELALRLAPGVRVTARVEDDAGEPVAAARVTLAEGGLSPFPLEATTDRAGRASLGPIAPGPASVAASAEGFVPRGAVPVPERAPRASGALGATSAASVAVTVTLARAGALEGRVVDARGYAVDGASIVVVGTDFAGAPIDEDPRRTRFREAHFAATLGGPAPLVRALLPGGELGVMPGPVPPIPHAASVAPPAVAPLGGAVAAAPPEPWVTRADGTFRAAPVSPGRVRALVRHPQFTDAMSDVVTLRSGGTAKVDVVMHAGGTLEGRVVDARGAGIGGVRVLLAAVRGAMDRATRTGTDGSFAFAAVPDEVTVSVAREDDPEPVARLTVTVPDGERRAVTLTLPEPRPALDARVVDDRGYPVDAAQLGAQSLEPSAPLRVTAFTNGRGEARIPSARGLPLRVEVRAPGRAPKIVVVDAEAAGLMVTLAPAESARGEVRQARGRGDPIADAEIVMYTELGARRTRTDRDGAFTIAELAPGAARLRVRAAGYAPKELDVTIDALGGARPVTLPRVELSGEGAVEGTVVDARGEPVQGARIARERVPVYLAAGAAPPGVAVSDARGHFRLGELAEGTCAFEVYAPDLGRARIDGARVVAGRATDLGKIALKEGGAPQGGTASRGGVAVTLGDTPQGEVVVMSVAESSEAERAGMAPDDVLVEIDRAPVHTIAEARARLSGPLGEDVVVKIERAGETLTVRVPREEVRR